WYPRKASPAATNTIGATVTSFVSAARSRSVQHQQEPPTMQQIQQMQFDRQAHDIVQNVYLQADATRTLQDEVDIIDAAEFDVLEWMSTYPDDNVMPEAYWVADDSHLNEMNRFVNIFLQSINDNQFCTLSQEQKQTWNDYLLTLVERRAAN